MRETLLNPETLEFRDFAPVSEAQAKAMFGETFKENVDAGVPEGVISDFADGAFKSIMDSKPQAELFSARVRAEGRMGNTITAQHVCFVEAQKCECVGGN